MSFRSPFFLVCESEKKVRLPIQLRDLGSMEKLGDELINDENKTTLSLVILLLSAAFLTRTHVPQEQH